MPGNHIVYIVPADDDGNTPQNFAPVLQPTVEPVPVADSENVVDNDSARSMTDITNTSCLFLGASPDICDISCSIGSRPNQYSICDAVISTNECYNNNVSGSCVEDEMAGCESAAATLNTVTTCDNGFIHSADTPLEPFSLSVLTDVMTS